MEASIVTSKFTLLLFLFTTNAFALSGTFKTYYSIVEDAGKDTFYGSLVNTFRPKVTKAINDQFTFYAAYAFSPSAYKKSFSNPSKQAYRAVDLNGQMYTSIKKNNSEFLINQNLDRFNINYSANWGSFNIGRAPVAFGSAKIVNPTDVLTPVTYQTLDKEERVGIDVIRLNYALGPLGILDIGYVVGDQFKAAQSASFLRLKLNVKATDISTMLMDFQDNLLLGIDLARSVGNASAWFENAYVVPKYFKNSTNLNNSLANYYRATLGIDYKLTQTIYSYVEYHYNGAGSMDPAKYISLQNKIPYLQGGVTLLGQHYLIPGMTYEINSLWKSTIQLLLNMNDLSMFNNLSLEHNIAQDVFIDLGAYLPIGTKTTLIQKSEFGVYPKIIYSALRYYF